MSIPSVNTGLFGAIVIDGERMARVTHWSASVQCEVTRFVSSGTLGWTSGIPSVLSASGTLDFKYESRLFNGSSQIGNNPGAVWPGIVAQLLLVSYVPDIADGDAIIAVDTAGADYWHFTGALFTEVSTILDIDAGEVVGGTASFEAINPVSAPHQRYGASDLFKTLMLDGDSAESSIPHFSVAPPHWSDYPPDF